MTKRKDNAKSNKPTRARECAENVKLSDFVENPDNPSVATDEDIARLAGKLKRVPLGLTAMRIAYVTDAIEGKRMVISGNKRLRVLKQAYGEDGEVPSEWFADVTAMSEAERHEFIVTANVSDGEWDVDKLLAQYDKSELGELMPSEDLEKLLDGIEEAEVECDDKYTKKVTGIVYEPTGTRPSEEELFDRTKTSELIEEIASAGIDDGAKAFLTAAAYRHTVFNYRLIAEYYANAPSDVQRLMERSGLVIVDLDSAIENGFCKFSERLHQLRGGEYDEDEIEV